MNGRPVFFFDVFSRIYTTYEPGVAYTTKEICTSCFLLMRRCDDLKKETSQRDDVKKACEYRRVTKKMENK